MNISSSILFRILGTAIAIFGWLFTSTISTAGILALLALAMPQKGNTPLGIGAGLAALVIPAICFGIGWAVIIRIVWGPRRPDRRTGGGV